MSVKGGIVAAVVRYVRLQAMCRSRRREHQETGGGGMVLPFDPMTMTFKDLHYFVPIPKVRPCMPGPPHLRHDLK